MKLAENIFSLIIIGLFICCSSSKNLVQKQRITKSKVAENEISKYPEFSWDKMPLYIHVRKNTAYTNEEIAYLASFPLITLEKSQANKTFSSTEVGALETAKAIKSVNNRTKILYYRNTIINWTGYKNDDEFIKANPDALLKNQKNKIVFMTNKVTPYFDITKEYVKEYWLNSITNMVNNSNYFDGVFLDANIKVLVPNYFSKRIGTVKQLAVEKAYLSMMSELKNRLGDNKLSVANIIRVRPEFKESGLEYLDFFDGSYLETFDSENFGMSYEAYLAKGIEAVQKAAKMGKIIAMTLGLGKSIENDIDKGIDDQRNKVILDEEINKRVDYLCAIFLICAQKYSYLYLHDGYLSTNSSVWLKTFDQFKKPIGKPKGDAIKSNYTYTRSFENVDVILDIKKQEATLTWK